ncbi:MAG: MarR family winged helix-turn-helix transcriptional regulator [Caldimonas sp.]
MTQRTSATPAKTCFYEPAGYCADESVGWLMKRALMSIAQAADRRLEPQGITHSQWAALYMLQCCRASTVAELAREMQSDPGAMTRLLDRLETKGFCRRERSTDDRRVVRIELTPQGEVAAQEVPVILAQVMNEHLAGFSKGEWSQLKDMLKRMVANGESAARSAG